MKKLFIVGILCLASFSAFGQDPWLKAQFGAKFEMLNLVDGSRTPIAEIKGTAFFLQSAYTGKLIVNGHNYKCSSVGYGTKVSTGEKFYYCNLHWDDFFAMFNAEVSSNSITNDALQVWANYRARWGAAVTGVSFQIGHDTQAGETSDSYSFLEPKQELKQVGFLSSSSLISPL